MCSGATSHGATFSPLASGTSIPLPPVATPVGTTRLSRSNDTAVPGKEIAVGVGAGSDVAVGATTSVGKASVGAGTSVGFEATVGAGSARLPQAAKQNPATKTA